MESEMPLLPEIGSLEAKILYLMAENLSCCPRDVGLERNVPAFFAALHHLRELGWAPTRLKGEGWGETDPGECLYRPELSEWLDTMAASIRNERLC